jgi:glycosyltransferase involved in cell wall biosynthesis
MRPLVSVGIAAYNQERFIARTLDSVLSQDYRPLQIVVSDDASTDGTPGILARYAAAFPDTICLQTHARNLGADENVASIYPLIEGEFVCWLGGDDVFLPLKLERQVAAFERDPEAVVCYHDVEVFDDRDGGTLFRYNEDGVGQTPHEGWVAEALVRERCFVSGISVMIRRALAPDVRHRPGIGACSDWLLNIELARRGRFVFLPEVLSRYRRHASNLSGSIESVHEERIFDIVAAEFPELRRAAAEGRLQHYLAWAVKAFASGAPAEAARLAGRLASLVRDDPHAARALPGALKVLGGRSAHRLLRMGRLRY